MSPAHHESCRPDRPEGSRRRAEAETAPGLRPAGTMATERGLTVLMVQEDEARIRDFRFDCRGETRCRAELGELLQLLERRHADIAIFLAHPNLVPSLIEELRRRGGNMPEMVIAPPTDAADARVTVSVSLSGLSESAYPQELLARLYEALRVAQGAEAATAGTAPEPAGSSVADSVAPAETPPADAQVQHDVGETGDAPVAADPPLPDFDELSRGVGEGGADDDRRTSAEVDELSARLERVLNQRLHRSQP